MLSPFYDEELIDVGGNKVRLAIDFRAIDVMEHLVGESGSTVPATAVVEAVLFSDPVPISIAGKVLYALLRRHHEEATLDEAAGLMFGPDGNRVALAMRSLLERAFNLGSPPKAKGKNPRKPRGASKPS